MGRLEKMKRQIIEEANKKILNEDIQPNEDDTIKLECFRLNPTGVVIDKINIEGKAVKGISGGFWTDEKNVPNIKVISTYPIDSMLSGQEKSDGIYVETISDPLLVDVLDIEENSKVLTHYNRNILSDPTKRHYCIVLDITDNLKSELQKEGVHIA